MLLHDNEPCHRDRETHLGEKRTIEQLLGHLQASEHDKFASHLYARRENRQVCERAGKGGKQIERCVMATLKVAHGLYGRASSGRTYCGLVKSRNEGTLCNTNQPFHDALAD